MRIQRVRGVGNFLRSAFEFVSPIFKKVVNHKTTKKMGKELLKSGLNSTQNILKGGSITGSWKKGKVNKKPVFVFD